MSSLAPKFALKLSVLAAMVIILQFASLPLGYAQEPTTEATAEEDPQGQAILQLLAVIDGLRGEILALDEQHAITQGDEQEALALQRHDKYQLLINELREFTSVTTSYIDAGNDLIALLGSYRDEILATGTLIRLKIDTYRDRLQSNSLNRDNLTTTGLQGYLEDSDIMDLGYSLLLSYIQLVERLDFDPALSRQYLLDNLPQRLTFLTSRIQLSAERKRNFERMLAQQNGDADTQNLILLTEEKLTRDIDSLRHTIEIANTLGIETAAYQSIVVRTTGQISSDILNTQVIGVLFDEWWLDTKHSIRSNLFGALFKVAVFIFILLIFRLLASLIRRIVRRSVESSRFHLSVLLRNMLVSWISRAVMLVGFLVALSQVGISLGPVLAGLGVAGFIVGFALQDTLGNFASGVMILIYRPFDVGDVVEAGSAFGTVKSMNLVSTTILTFDNQTLIIPNNKIWGDTIKNVTAQKVRRVDLMFGIGYNDDISKAEAVLKDIIDQHEKVLADPKPIIKLHNLGESSVDFVVRPWCLTADYWDVYWDITRAVKMRFDAEGISIPFPQRDIHIIQTDA